MDEILIKLIKNKNEAKCRLDYCNTDFEMKLNTEALNSAEKLLNSYLQYKKVEYDYNKAYDLMNAYYDTIRRLECRIGKTKE